MCDLILFRLKVFLFSLATRTGEFMQKVELENVSFSLVLLVVSVSQLSSKDLLFVALICVLNLLQLFHVSPILMWIFWS